jgi:hypothetical protein
MQAWLQKAGAVIPPARERYTAFESGSRLAAELLARTEAELRRSKREIDSSWGWSRSESGPRIDSLARAFVRDKNHWERIQERNWAGYDIERAASTCQNLITVCEGVLQDLAQTIETIQPRQDQLAGRSESVMGLLDQNGASLSSSDRIDIRALLEMARETPDYDFAKRLLEYAETMALNRSISPVTRNEITSLLQNRQESEEDRARR